MAAPRPDTELIPDIVQYYNRYVVLPSYHHELVVATWTLHTWLFDAAQVTPYLYIYSKEPGSGKTRLLDTMSMVARNAKRADDMTPVVMFELIERECPTLLIDECDTVWSGSRNEPMRRIINTGYKRGGCSWRIRAREVKEFSTHSPKVLCGINNGFMPRTIRDRCIPIELSKRKKAQKIERFNEFGAAKDPQREELLDRIWTFRENHYSDVLAMAPRPMTNVTDRQDEISEPLLALAAVLGHERALRKALEHVYSSVDEHQSNPTHEIMQRIHQAFDGQQKVFTENLCRALGPMYNGRTLALWLEPFGIAPKDVRIGGDVKKGYTASQFMQIWSEQLGVQPATENQELAA